MQETIIRKFTVEYSTRGSDSYSVEIVTIDGIFAQMRIVDDGKGLNFTVNGAEEFKAFSSAFQQAKDDFVLSTAILPE